MGNRHLHSHRRPLGSAAYFVNERVNDRREREVLVLREKAATAETALLDLKSNLRSRTIDDLGRDAILDVLSRTPHDRPLEISLVGGSTTEPSELAHEIAKFLTTAGWTIAEIEGGVALGAPPVGLIVRTPNTEHEHSAQALGLANALTMAGFETRAVLSEHVRTPGNLSFMVGMKP